MKKVLLLALAILVIVGVAPFFIGQKAENELQTIYEQVASTPEITVDMSDYQRDWFSATARVILTVEIPDADLDDKLQLVVHHELQHGPFLTQAMGFGVGLVDIGTRLELPAIIKQEFPDIDQTVNDALDLQARMGFDGSLDGIYKLNEFQFAEEGTQITVKAATLNALVTKDGQFKGDGQWDGMSISDNQSFGVTLGLSTTEYDLQAVSGNAYGAGSIYSGAYTGTSNFEMSELRISGKEIPGNIQVSKLNMYTNTQVNGDLLSMQFDTGADEINIMGQTYSDLVFDQTIENLDFALLQEMNQLGSQSHQLSSEDLEQLQTIGMQLLTKKPVWQVRQLGVTTPQGPIRSEMTISLNEAAVNITDPMTIATALIIDASGYVPEAFVNAMGMSPMVQPFVDQGMLKKEGENLVFELNYEGGQMSLFGKPMPLGI